jgi:hypothetical protein
MGTLTPNASIIYESPDGGETVYGRYHGTTEKFLVGYSSKKQQQLKDVEETKIWVEIFNLAKTDEQLQKELDRVKMFYYLRKNDG